MVSIQGKLTRLIVIGILTMSALIMGINTILTNRYAEYSARITLNETCSAQSLKLNNQFSLVEQSVRDMIILSEKDRPTYSELNNKKLTDDYIESFRETAVSIANNTDGAITVYYRLNPDICGTGTTGFFWVKSEETGEFEENEITDLYLYDPEDVEHVGWYYIPVRAGKPVWMEPYYNQNIGIEMISYVVPFFEGNRLIGVVGMDVDFSAILDIVDDVDIYQSGGASLFCMSNSTVYQNENTIFNGDIPSDLYNTLLSANESEELISYSEKGNTYRIAYSTMKNNMKLLVYVPKNEINSQRNFMILISANATLLLSVIFIFLTIKTAKRITDPIKTITSATKEFAEGNWDAQIGCNTNDELKTLTDSILIMAENTKKYIGKINDMAFRDGLTGLRNKACYIDYVERLSSAENYDTLPYSVVVFDVNGLKAVNDNLGHEEGDKLIKSAAAIICRYFSHSPVFRIGGDEFVSIVDSGDYENRRMILISLQAEMRNVIDTKDASTVSIACGMADHPEDAGDYNEIFRLADERMYKNKIEMKGGVMPR